MKTTNDILETAEGHRFQMKGQRPVKWWLNENHVIRFEGVIVAAKINNQWYLNPLKKTDPNTN